MMDEFGRCEGGGVREEWVKGGAEGWWARFRSESGSMDNTYY